MKSFYIVVNGSEIHFEAETMEDAIMLAADTSFSPPLAVFEKKNDASAHAPIADLDVEALKKETFEATAGKFHSYGTDKTVAVHWINAAIDHIAARYDIREKVCPA